MSLMGSYWPETDTICICLKLIREKIFSEGYNVNISVETIKYRDACFIECQTNIAFKLTMSSQIGC